MDIIKIILALVVLINPSAALMLFVGYTQGYSVADKRKVALFACVAVFVTIAFFTIFGAGLLSSLGISLGSFRVAGGLLLLLIAINMMSEGSNPVKPQASTIEGQKTGSLTDNAIVPLAIPMMIGPGGISTVIIYASQMQSLWQKSMIIVAGFLISAFCYVSLMAAGRISRFLGDTGINVINRIMGILLAALAIEIAVSGLRTIFPQLA